MKKSQALLFSLSSPSLSTLRHGCCGVNLPAWLHCWCDTQQGCGEQLSEDTKHAISRTHWQLPKILGIILDRVNRVRLSPFLLHAALLFSSFHSSCTPTMALPGVGHGRLWNLVVMGSLKMISLSPHTLVMPALDCFSDFVWHDLETMVALHAHTFHCNMLENFLEQGAH